MDRRGFLKATGGALGTAVGALTLKRGIGLPEADRGVQGQQVGASATLSAVPFSGANWPADTNWAQRDTNGEAAFGEMTLVTGPDPGTYAYVAFGANGEAAVRPGPFVAPFTEVSGMAIPRTEFPEFDPAHGVVTITDPTGKVLPPDTWTVRMIRAHYFYMLGQRTPEKPLDGNHLSIRFMPKSLNEKFGGVLLNGEHAPHIDESYDGLHGWVVQLELGEKGEPIVFDGRMIRKRILTGIVQHWADTAPFWPGDYTAPLLR